MPEMSSALRPQSPTPTAITLHSVSRVLEIEFSDGRSFRLPFEFLRVYSPSAEVQGHAPGQETLQVGKREVTIESAEPVGHYGLQPTFSDGHNSGIYTWDLLYQMGENHDTLWAHYLERLQQANASRDPDAAGGALPHAGHGGGCGSGGCGSAGGGKGGGGGCGGGHGHGGHHHGS